MMMNPIRKYRTLQRTFTRNYAPLIGASLVVIAIAGYAMVMTNSRLRADPASYLPLLNLIADAESGSNYNAYFGNSTNTSIVFTDMTIAEVLQWQQEFIQQGNPSSAVGRYQIINTTLSELIREKGINAQQKFSPTMQDRLAIALLERRGSEAYLNNELSRKAFAANLAREWAGLPKVIGKQPDKSYYAGDGLNQSLVKPEAVLNAIKPIKAQ